MFSWLAKYLLQVVVLAALLQGCAHVPEQPVASDAWESIWPRIEAESRFGTRLRVPPFAEVLDLLPDRREQFLAYLQSPQRQALPLNERVFLYLENFTGTFQYQNETLVVAEAFSRNGGNCMTLALMTTALADLAGVRIGYQLLDDAPVFELRGTLVQKGVHVRSLLYQKVPVTEANGTYLFQVTGLKVDYFPTHEERFIANLSRASFMAMYYRNVAAAALVEQDSSKAYWYTVEALRHAPDDGASINLLAVMYRRAGDPSFAETLYRYGLDRAEEKLSLLKNYEVLLSLQGRTAEASVVRQRLNAMDDPSPFHWLQLARAAPDAAEFEDAIHYYRRALAIAPEMHEAYLGLAESQARTGKDAAAIASMRKALEYAPGANARQRYQAKLSALTKKNG